MINYLIGYAREITPDTAIIEVNGIGYSVTIAKPQDFRLDQLVKVFTYMQVKEDGICLYGFKTKDELNLFLRLINVSGIGPKTAIGMFYNVTVDQLISAIETGNTAFLKKLPGIGPKAAQQIILDLKGKLVFDSYSNKQAAKNTNLEDAREGLKALGFKVAEIDNVLSKIGNEPRSSEEYLREALKLLRK